MKIKMIKMILKIMIKIIINENHHDQYCKYWGGHLEKRKFSECDPKNAAQDILYNIGILRHFPGIDDDHNCKAIQG